MAILQAEHITKIFGPDPRRALSQVREGATREQIQKKFGLTIGVADVSFEVEKGEILVIMGLSGSGKSTLVRCINRLITPTDGKLYIDGEDVTSMDSRELRDLRRRKLGMVFQRFALFPHRSVVANAEYGLEVMGVSRSKRRDKAMEALELVGLKGWEERSPDELSGGMQQRVGLARALAVDPEIILMDEALSALDPLIRKDMQNELIALQRKLHKTILFITHDLDEAINLGDRIVLMKDGRVVQTGTAEEILTNPASRYVERFVEDVDFSKVLTAESVMKPVHNVVHEGDGPRVALRKMRDSGVSSLFVVNSDGALKGLARAERMSELIDEEDSARRRDYVEQARSVTVDTPLQEVIPMMAERRDVVAVVDDRQRLRGVMVVGALLAGLAEGVDKR